MGITNNKVINLPLNLEELNAISNLLHGRAHIRFNPDETWTAEKLMILRTRVDTELALKKGSTSMTTPETPDWKGPGEKPHDYFPDIMAMGDCSVCGHTYEAHQPKPLMSKST